MPFPIAHGFVGASVVAASRKRLSLKQDWLVLLFGAFLAIAPDFDFFLVWVFHMRGWHRAFTHSIFFALVAGCLMLAMLGARRMSEAIAYCFALLSHGLLDFAATKAGGGVELLWPFSSQRLKLGLIGISEFGLKHQTRLELIVDMFKACALELLIFAPVFLAILLLKRRRFAST
jgi:inner membrane protein